jgi:hypothetical protein
MKNLDIRKALKKANIYHYECATALDISEMTFLKKLRKELPEAEKKKIFDVISNLQKAKIIT